MLLRHTGRIGFQSGYRFGWKPRDSVWTEAKFLDFTRASPKAGLEIDPAPFSFQSLQVVLRSTSYPIHRSGSTQSSVANQEGIIRANNKAALPQHSTSYGDRLIAHRQQPLPSPGEAAAHSRRKQR